MGIIVIDIVLIPPREIIKLAVNLNKKLVSKSGSQIYLDAENCVPHISLCMGCLETKDLETISGILKDIADEFSIPHLEIENLATETTQNGEIISVMNVKDSPQLSELQQIIMKRLWSYLTYDVNASMLFDPDKVNEGTLNWIKNYSKIYHNPSLFKPHITIGFGEAENLQSPKRFKALQLAVFQLGNNCTCRKLLISINIY